MNLHRSGREGAGMGGTARMGVLGVRLWYLGCRGRCVCVAAEIFQGPLWEVNEKILAVAAGRERGLKCLFPRAFCPTATLCQSRYFSVMVIVSIF